MKKYLVIILLLVISLIACSSPKEDISHFGVEVVVEPSLDYNGAEPFSNGLALVYKYGPKYPTTMDVSYGFIDEKGKEVIPLKFSLANSFSDGFAAVWHDHSTFAYIDCYGEELLCFRGAGCPFSEGLALIANDEDGFVGFIDTMGNRVITLGLEVDKAYNCWGGYVETFYASGFSEGLAYVYNVETKKYGYIDHTGKIVIPYQYDFAGHFSDGLAVVQINGKYGYIDKVGKLVIKCMFDECPGYFYEGYAHVLFEDKFAYIDKTGKVVFESNGAGGRFSEGRAVCGKAVDGLNIIYGYINKDGVQVIDYKYTWVAPFKNGLALVQNQDQTTSFINRNGDVIISDIFWGNDFSEGHILFQETQGGPLGILKITIE